MNFLNDIVILIYNDQIILTNAFNLVRCPDKILTHTYHIVLTLETMYSVVFKVNVGTTS